LRLIDLRLKDLPGHVTRVKKKKKKKTVEDELPAPGSGFGWSGSGLADVILHPSLNSPLSTPFIHLFLP